MASRFSTVRHCRIAVLLAATIAVAPIAALAQDQRAPAKQQKKLPEAPGKLPKVGADRTRGLDFLFGALKAAPDQASAKHVEARIWALWLQTPSDTAALLMMRAKAAMDAQQPDLAIKLLDAVVKLRPDYVEAWNRRATLYYLQNDYVRSLADIQQVLVREPRHFGALAGLGMIMQDLGDDKRALDAFRKAIAINPHLEKVPELVKQLTEKVEGRDI
jgi:tetratricopeptide (TPR) repeat protein